MFFNQLLTVCPVFLSTREATWYIISVLPVCLSVCSSNDNFRKPCHRKFIFADPVYLERIRVKFVYDSYRVKVKVTDATKVENRYSHNVKLRSAITPLL